MRLVNRFAVMGNPISHSLSPFIHECFAKQTGIALIYEKRLVEKGALPRAVDEFFLSGGKGLNITLPFKEDAYALAQVKKEACRLAKAANTLWMEQGKLQADNTDGRGFIKDLMRSVSLKDKKVLILGAGGATRGIIAPLLAAPIASLTIANRSMDRALALQNDFPPILCMRPDALQDGFDILIHATSAHIHHQGFIWPKTILKNHPFCYDLSYTLHGETPFVFWAKQGGCLAVDGLGMLVEQAAASFEIWHGVLPDTESVLVQMRK